MDLSAVGLPALEALALALESGRLRTPLSRGAAEQAAALDRAAWQALAGLNALGLGEAQAAALLRAVAVERRRAQALQDRVELVWTGPEEAGAGSRDTAAVVRQLFREAERTVLIASFALDTGERARSLFGELAARHDAEPGLAVRFYVNLARPYGEDDLSEQALIQRFARRFRDEVWPGARPPELFYDPRALEPGHGPRACLHAKCVVVDGRWSFVTSANFTEAAHGRNIEAGVLIEDPVFAAALTGQLHGLAASGALRPVALGRG